MLYVGGRHQQSGDSLLCSALKDGIIVPRNGVGTLLAVLLSWGTGGRRVGQLGLTVLVLYCTAMASLRLVVRPSRIIRLPPLSFRRFASAYAPEPTSTFRRAAYGTLFALTAAVGVVYYFDSRAAIHRHLITPLIRNALDPESAHKLAVSVLENGLGPRDMLPDDERLETEVKGHPCCAL